MENSNKIHPLELSATLPCLNHHIIMLKLVLFP
jgi:hypothetical protein